MTFSDKLTSRKLWIQIIVTVLTFWLVREGVVPPETWIGYLVSVGLYHVGQGLADGGK